MLSVLTLTLSLAACTDVQTVAVDGGAGGADAGDRNGSLLCVEVTCDDGNACTNDACDPTGGDCLVTDVADGSFCDFSGSAGQCVDGTCEDAELCLDADTRCDDTNECTEDTCEPIAAMCAHTPVGDGTDCDLGGNTGVCTAGTCGVPDSEVMAVETSGGGVVSSEQYHMSVSIGGPLGQGIVSSANHQIEFHLPSSQ